MSAPRPGRPDAKLLHHCSAWPQRRPVVTRWPLRRRLPQMLCVPNTPSKLGTWGDRCEGDYDFADTTKQLRGTANRSCTAT